MGTLKIGSAKNMVGVTIEPSTVLFNGDNVRKIISGVTQIWSDEKPLVPIMTSNTAPSGKAFASSELSGCGAWKAFNGTNIDDMDIWSSATGVGSGYLGYQFTAPACVKSFSIENRSHRENAIKAVKTVQLQGSNDNSQWVNIGGQFTNKEEHGAISKFEVDNDTAYFYYRLNIINGYASDLIIARLQFYGSQLVALIPVMTSNTAPSGEVSCSTEYGTTFSAWKAFDGETKNGWCPKANETNNHVQYVFNSLVNAKYISIDTTYNVGHSIQNMILYVMNENNEWVVDQECTVSFNKEFLLLGLKNTFKIKGVKLFFADAMYVSQVKANIVANVQLYG